MENKEVKIGQAVQCKKTDWFKKIYGDMIGDEEPKSITLSDGTRLEINPAWFVQPSGHITSQSSASSTRRAARLTTMEDELMERIFSSNYSNTIPY